MNLYDKEILPIVFLTTAKIYLLKQNHFVYLSQKVVAKSKKSALKLSRGWLGTPAVEILLHVDVYKNTENGELLVSARIGEEGFDINSDFTSDLTFSPDIRGLA